MPKTIAGLTRENVVEVLGLKHLPNIDKADITFRSSLDKSPEYGSISVGIRGPGYEMTRHFIPGSKHVSHDTFFLDEGLQGKGIGTKVLRDQMLNYKKMGIEEVGLSAAMTGRYVWPKMGFRPEPEQEKSYVNAFRAHVRTYGHGDASHVKTAPDIANYKSPSGAKVGKDWLLDKPGQYYSATPATVLKAIGRK